MSSTSEPISVLPCPNPDSDVDGLAKNWIRNLVLGSELRDPTTVVVVPSLSADNKVG